MSDSALAAWAKHHVGQTFGGTPTRGANASDITGTTPVEIIAAPGAGYKLVITDATIVNKTAAETPLLKLQDDAGTPVVKFQYLMRAGPATDVVKFNPPIELDENVALDGVATTATGDCIITANGYTVPA